MDSSSRETVLKFFQVIIQWKKKQKRRKRDTVKFNWTQFHLLVVHDYVSKLSLDSLSDSGVLRLAKKFKDDFQYLMAPISETWLFIPGRHRIDARVMLQGARIVFLFARELKEFFVVPKQHQLFQRDDVAEQNELVTTFIDFLLRLLHRRTGSVNLVKDRVGSLEKELRFLLSVVGDTMLIRDEHEQVQNLSAQIEAVVNEAGSLVHSIVFSTFADPIFKTMDERLGILLEHIDSFKANVMKFSNQRPVIGETNTTTKTAAEGSLFIIDSLLCGLEDLLNQEDNMIIADVKDQIKVLGHELKFLQSLIKELKFSQSLSTDMKASQHSEAEELKELVMRIQDAAYEAEYLISTFLVGDAPFCRSFSIRLSHVLHKIKLIKITGIQGIKKNYGIGASKVAKKYFSAQLSLQNKGSSKFDDIIVQIIEQKMDSFSRYTVLRIFQLIIEWKKKKRKIRKGQSVTFNWTLFHLSVVHDYVLKLSLDSGLGVLSLLKLFKDELICYFVQESSTIDANLVVSFVQKLKAFFVVPKQRQLFKRDDVVDQNELVAAFINLLLRLLHFRTGSVNSVKDRVDCLEKELRFLLTVVGDVMLIRDEHGQVQNLLAETEAVVNEAGSLVHSIVFSAFGDSIFERINERFGILLKHMDSFKDNVIKFLNQQPVIVETNTAPKRAAEGSPFIVDSLIHDLEDLLNQEDNVIADVKDQIKVLQQELKLSQCLIKDETASHYSEVEDLKEPVMRIRDSAYEAEYLIKSFLVGDAPFWYFSIRLSHVLNKIKLLNTGIQGNRKNYEIGGSKVAKNFSTQLSLQNKRSSKVDDIIIGLEDKEIDILNHLEGGKEHLQIIGIFGMPGLGKTTFAKKLYNHPIVKYKFDRCSWCLVSQNYHRKNLLIDILISLKSELGKDEIRSMEEESLEHIHKSLKGRRYLIVIDDIWSSNAWYDLQRCLPDDRNESRILFTSRNKDVAPSQSIIYELPCMSDEQCWELLEKKVFQNEHCPPQLVEVGKKIATNCRGLPLAVVVIAGVLSSMEKEGSTWKNVEGNLASYIFSYQNNFMMQILELSYKHLPNHLKPCFLYFGAFPGDMKIPIRRLKWLWAAEGFIHKEGEKSVESVGEEYLMELIDKSLVIAAERRSDGGVKSCVIRDLLRDLCLKRCKEDNFLELVDKNYMMYKKHHRLLVHNAQASRIPLPFGLHIRSLFGSVPNSGVNMKLLSVLHLLETSYDGYDLDGIKLLVHLRYLAIKYYKSPPPMGIVPWIDNLVNLEFLFVVTDAGFNTIPLVIVKMMKLRYVNFISFYPLSFAGDCDRFRTNNLEFLGFVSIESLKDEEILKCSPCLRKLECKCAAFWVEETSTCRYPDFGFFTQLESLNVSFSTPKMRDIHVALTNLPTKENMYVSQISLLKKLITMAPPNLPLYVKKLSLSGLRLPWDKMSIIGGLPNLQVLKLLENAFVGEIWETRDDEFQQLTFLKLEYLYNLTQWNVPCSQHFPKLRHLVLINCRNLQEIPSEVGEIVTLQLIDVRLWCLKSLAESARQIEQEQRNMGNEELMVCLEKAYERPV